MFNFLLVSYISSAVIGGDDDFATP